MNKNKWLDMWMILPRGQRRILLVLLCVIAILCVIRGVAALHRNNDEVVTADYSALEQEITEFRSQLDTIPLDERQPVYVRRTNAQPDTTVTKPVTLKHRNTSKQQHTPREIETMQRVGDTEK